MTGTDEESASDLASVVQDGKHSVKLVTHNLFLSLGVLLQRQNLMLKTKHGL